MNSKIKLVLKFALVAALLYFLGKKGFISVEATAKAFHQKTEMGTAFGLLVLAAFLGVWRWQILLRAQDIHLSFKRVAELNFVGIFFNLALPGAVSGDFVKAFYIGKESEGKRAPAFSSILFDRVTGLSALIVVSASALAVSLLSPLGPRLFASLEYFVLFAGLCALSFYVYLFFVPMNRDPLKKIFNHVSTKSKVGDSILRIYEGIRTYRAHPRETLSAVAISIVIHILVILAFINLGLALGVTDVPTLGCFVVVPLGLLVTAIPVTPAGVGTGHAAYLALFHLLGSERGGDIFSLFVLMNLTIGAFGGLVYLRFRAGGGLPNQLNQDSV